MQAYLCFFSLFLFLISFPVHAAFPDPLVNTATVTAPVGVTDPAGNNIATDSNNLDLPSLAIVKTLDSNADEDTSTTVTLNDTLTYSVTVTNDGNTTLNNVVVSDALLTPNSNTCVTLAPSATCVLTGTHVVSQAESDAGTVDNTGSVTSTEVPGPTTDTLNTPVLSFISINDVTIVEGNAGVTAYNFTVSVDGGGNAANNIDFTFDTVDGTATLADTDYVQVTGGSGTIVAGTNSTTITVNVNGDTNVETNETFLVNVSAPVNATINDAQGIGTINNDDSAVSVAKACVPDTIVANAPTTLTISLGNSNVGSATLTADLVDNMPTGMTALAVNPATTCPGVIDISASSVVRYVSGSNIPSGGCDIAVDITSNAQGTATNVIPANSLQTTLGNNLVAATDDLTVIGDPLGYFYCEATGQIIPGGNVSFTPPGGGVVTLLEDGSAGRYQALFAGGGIYNMNIMVPPGTALSTSRLVDPLDFDGTGGPNPTILGSGEGVAGFLADFSLITNTPWYDSFDFTAGDPIVLNNNIPLTNCAAITAPVLLTKTATPDEISIGDVVQYNLQIENSSGAAFTGTRVVDNIPGGFSYVDNSALLITAGPDGIINTGDDVESAITVSGADPITFENIDIPVNQVQLIRYLLRVSSGVVEGEYVNTARIAGVGGVNVSNEASATVRVIQDPILQKTTIIGKVFNDRDEDGWQDSAHATKVTIKSEYFGWDGHSLGTIFGRNSEFDSIEENQVEVRIPLDLQGDNSFVIESAEGTVIKVDNDGNVQAEYRDEKRKGLTAQDLTVMTVRDSDEFVITITNHGIQEAGIPGVRLATVEGLLVETDQYGRYHLADIDGGRWERGRNFIIKVDPATLPEGSEFTTENPRVLRITQALMSKFNFGVKLPSQEAVMMERGYGASKRVERDVEVVETREIKDVVDPIYFSSGKAKISQTALNTLQQEISRLQNKERVVVRISGHADSRKLSEKTKARFGDNHGLAQARAEQVAKILQQELNLNENMITVVEHGADKPIASNDTKVGRAQNRRTEIDVVYDERYTKTVVEIDYTPTSEPIIKRESEIPNGGAIWAVEDPATLDPRLNAIAQGGIILKRGEVKDPINFTLYSNYIAFIDRWELSVYANNDRDLIKPIATQSGDRFAFTDTVEWQAQLVDEKYFEEGESLFYVLRVFDKQGRMDETIPRALTVTDELIIKVERRELKEEREEVALASYGESNLLRQTIPLAGSRVRVNGVDLDEDYTIKVNGEKVIVDEDGKFVLEQHLPLGKHQMVVEVSDANGLDFERTLDVDVSGKYMFIVGLANLTVGENDLSGSVEALGDDDHFDEDVWVDGRVAFYLKGKIKGKYLVTAQLDSTEDELRNLGDRLEEEDPTEIFRRLDPDRYYAVYGDDSTTIDDTDSQGAVYLRVDWDKSMALWGNYNTDLTGTEFAQYNRSLYGAKLEHRNVDTTKFGEHKHEVHLFGSEAQTAAAHNEFISTGGSLYYLRDTDVVQGSEKVWVEVRTRNTEQVVETLTLEHGRDFDIDYLQGRIILTRPLTQFDLGSGPSIIRDTPLDGNDVFLLADYEYRPDAFSADDITTGARGKAWLNDFIALGGTYVNEDRDGVDYELKGTDVTLRAGKGTYLRLEYAESDAKQADNNFLSANGGISFNKQNNLSDDADGEAKGVEARVNFAELSDHKGYLMGWWKDRDAGFSSTARLDDGIETIDTGIEAQWQATERLDLTARATSLDKKTESEFSAISIQGDYEASDRLSVGLELRHEDEKDEILNTDGEATLTGAEIRYDLTEQTEVYTSGQVVVDDEGDYESNALATVGVETQVNDRLALKTELSTGDRGDAVVLGVEYDVTPNMNISLDAGFGSGATSQVGTNYTTANGLELYGSYATDPDRTDSGESLYTFGSRKNYGNGLSIYSENQFGEGEEEQSIARTYGLDFDLTDQWRLSASMQKNDIEYDQGDIDRRAATLGASYKGDDLKFGSVLEFREDDNSQTNEDAAQWVTSNTVEWQQSESLRWLGKVELSTTHSDANKSDEAKYAELDIGFAYRPAFNDRLNILGKYTFVYDLASSGQDTSFADQRSHIFAVEGIYDVNQKWEVGAKLAYKTGDTRVTRGAGPWFETGAHLAVARARYHMLKKWDALLEYRWLETEERDDSKDGALLGVYRHVGKHMKVGTGYNFTDFDDDLTDNDYDSNGWFFDITGKY